MDTLETLQTKDKQTSHFLETWKPFIIAILNNEETEHLMKPFENTEWYITPDIANILGRLKPST